MSKSTFRILFYLRKNYLNKSGKAGIMIRLTVNGDMVQFSSKLDIEPSLWDTKAGKAAGNSVKARQMNSMLEDIRTALSNHYRYVESRDSFVTAEKVRNAFLGYEVRQQTLLELFKQHNEDASKLNGISKAPATLVKYDRTYRRLEEFMKVKYKVSDIALREIDHKFVTDFEFYLRTVQPVQREYYGQVHADIPQDSPHRQKQRMDNHRPVCKLSYSHESGGQGLSDGAGTGAYSPKGL